MRKENEKSQKEEEKAESFEEIFENSILQPTIQGLICGAAHLLAFHMMRRFFENKQWI